MCCQARVYCRLYPAVIPDRIRCEITQLEIGLELEDASRYAETIAGRLEIVCDALEAIGLTRRAETMRVWLQRWLQVVDVLFESRLAEQRFLSLPEAVQEAELEKLN
jgi:hypothetical protein